MYSTGNETRDLYIVNAIKFLHRHEQPVSLAAVAARLDPAFELDDTELAGIMGNLAGPVEFEGDPAELKHSFDGGTLARQPRQNFEPPRANGAAPPHTDPPKSKPSLDFNESVERLKELQRGLAEHRNEVTALSRLDQEKKGVLARAVSAWQVGALEGDPEKRRMDEVRDHLRGVTEARAKRVESLPPELRSKYGSAADFARKQKAVPPGVDPQTLRKGSGRGAFPSSARVLPGVGVK
jgi:hypothetical protein